MAERLIAKRYIDDDAHADTHVDEGANREPADPSVQEVTDAIGGDLEMLRCLILRETALLDIEGQPADEFRARREGVGTAAEGTGAAGITG